MNGGASPRGPRLRIVAINDVYSVGNLPLLKPLVDSARTNDPADVLLVTIAGDFVAPSLLSSLDAGRGMVECLNALGITHACYGNHEADIPTEELRLRVGELHGVWLNTNMTSFEPRTPRFDVVTVTAPGGRTVRVGLLGVVLDDRAAYLGKPFGGAPISPPNEAALLETRRLLEEERCAVVIPLTHQSMSADRALAASALSVPFPVILGGHEHTAFQEKIGETWVLKAGADGTLAFVIDLTWPGEPVAADSRPDVTLRLVDVSHDAPDPTLRALAERHLARVHELDTATLRVLRDGESLSSVGTRSQQTTMGSFLCDAMRDGLAAEGCVFNGGGIRASRVYAERFTYGDLTAEVPFENELCVARIPGAVLAAAIAVSRSIAPAEAGRFLQVDSGMVVDEEHRLRRIAGGPLDPERLYRIALVRDLLFGMDGIVPFVSYGQTAGRRIPAAGSGRGVKLVLVEELSRALYGTLGGFDVVDADKDGTLTAEELSASAGRATGSPSPLTGRVVLAALDRSKDGSLSRDETGEPKDPSA